jgi:hypothetical protein
MTPPTLPTLLYILGSTGWLIPIFLFARRTTLRLAVEKRCPPEIIRALRTLEEDPHSETHAREKEILARTFGHEMMEFATRAIREGHVSILLEKDSRVTAFYAPWDDRPVHVIEH